MMPDKNGFLNRTPLFHCNGSHDENIPLETSILNSKLVLEKAFQNVDFNIVQNLGHETNEEQVDCLSDFIDERLPPVKKKLYYRLADKVNNLNLKIF